MVELALLLPVLVLLVFGLVEFGRAYNAKVTVTHAAREGVREYAINGDAGAAATVARNAATSLDPGLISVSTTGCTPGDPTELTVQYPFTYDIPLFGNATINLTGTGVMRCGG
jgi:Flp pilus assembly protein TadG